MSAEVERLGGRGLVHWRPSRSGFHNAQATYGPRLHPQDGRVVSNFVMSALRGEPLTIYKQQSAKLAVCRTGSMDSGSMDSERALESPPGQVIGGPNQTATARTLGGSPS
jgi:hypothetical protein